MQRSHPRDKSNSSTKIISHLLGFIFSIISARQLARLRVNKEFFIDENKKRVAEAMRPGKPKTITDIFGGVEGSFKKLDID